MFWTRRQGLVVTPDTHGSVANDSADYECSTDGSTSLPPSRCDTLYGQEVGAFLLRGYKTGCLGPGRRELPASTVTTAYALLRTLPLALMGKQLVWSAVVTALGYAVAERGKGVSTLSEAFWTSRLRVSLSVLRAVGWSLFVLLVFFARDAGMRFRDAQHALDAVGVGLGRVARHLQLHCSSPSGGVAQRVRAHLVAYPVALKMHLRGEGEADQLRPLLLPADARDALRADATHLHCSRVVRAHLHDAAVAHGAEAADVDAAVALDDVDLAANVALRIAEFHPSFAYVNHIFIFLHIWLMFLPLTLIESSGWFTMPWALLFTYCVGMLFNISVMLNDPFGFDIQDIKLNRLCSKLAYQVLQSFGDTTWQLHPADFADTVVDLPPFLASSASGSASISSGPPPVTSTSAPTEEASTVPSITLPVDPPTSPPTDLSAPRSTRSRSQSQLSLFPLRLHHLRAPITLSFLVFLGWSTFVIVFTWFVTRDDPRPPGVRWWRLYIPVTSGTAEALSLAVFLLLSFWLDDAYSRYSHALHHWTNYVHPQVHALAFHFCTAFPRGLVHSGDVVRILAHLAAIPVTAKLALRDARDLVELKAYVTASDYSAAITAPDTLKHLFSVIHTYVRAAECKFRGMYTDGGHPVGTASIAAMRHSLSVLEDSFAECSRLRSFPISSSFTVHICVVSVVWLLILAPTLVISNGFFAFVIVVPIGYSVINLLVIAYEMSDPFGNDSHDIPLDDICNDLVSLIRRVHGECVGGLRSFMQYEDYDRESFKPKPKFVPVEANSRSTSEVSESNVVNIQIGYVDLDPARKCSSYQDPSSVGNVTDGFVPKKTTSNIPTVETGPLHEKKKDQSPSQYILSACEESFRSFPRVSFQAIAAILFWNVVATFTSWGLAKLWDDNRQLTCREWCSAIDIQGSVLGSAGFSLFLMLAFRATESMNRYREGTLLMKQLDVNLRTLAAEFVQGFRDGTFHYADKERIVAHLVQVPICLRDVLLDVSPSLREREKGLLALKDRKLLENSENPLDHLLQTVEAYLIFQDMNPSDEIPSPRRMPLAGIAGMKKRLESIRRALSQTMSVKRFPVILSYSRHQRLFMVVWLGLLPLTMTAQSGFLTIMWATLIGYVVLALEGLATKLVDPYGRDASDIPVERLCDSIADHIIDAVDSVNWDCDFPAQKSEICSPGLGAKLEGVKVFAKYTVAHFKEDLDTGNVLFSAPRAGRLKWSSFAHLLRSVPWWKIMAVVVWTSFGSTISFLGRRESSPFTTRWWVSIISIDSYVATYLSFATFTLLAFYVQASYARYKSAGDVWGDTLRHSLHYLASVLLSDPGMHGLHGGGQDRLLGHIAAIPLCLKMELRDRRDLREVKGLLSYEDLSRLQYATVMTSHCLGVIRSYVYNNSGQSRASWRNETAQLEIVKELVKVEEMITESHNLNSFELAPGFVVVLNMFLSLWFLVLPFVLAENSGWITIMWVFLASFGLLGMYHVASELQHPFGSDLNDFDLDSMADSITADVLFVRQKQKEGSISLIKEGSAPERWASVSSGSTSDAKKALFGERKGTPEKIMLMERFRLSLIAVPVWVMLAVTVWAAFVVSMAYVLRKDFENETCFPWFCSTLALDEAFMEYIGFALFLVLAFRLHDSHSRFVRALLLWHEGVVGLLRIVSNRLFQRITPGTFHREDVERIGGHLVAYAICLMGSLRGKDYEEKLRQVLSNGDVQDLLNVTERVDHCMDVVRAYVQRYDRMGSTRTYDQEMIMGYLRRLGDITAECQSMKRIPPPLGYVHHMRLFTWIWIAILPFGLVESSGWLTILWTSLVSYGVVGMECWAERLSDPFGQDISDLPLDTLCNRAIDVVMINARLLRNGIRPFVDEGFRDSSGVLSLPGAIR